MTRLPQGCNEVVYNKYGDDNLRLYNKVVTDIVYNAYGGDKVVQHTHNLVKDKIKIKNKH